MVQTYNSLETICLRIYFQSIKIIQYGGKNLKLNLKFVSSFAQKAQDIYKYFEEKRLSSSLNTSIFLKYFVVIKLILKIKKI